MATPSPVVRLAPNGIHLRDGCPTFITFQNDPDIPVWEKVVSPPGVDGGDPIQQATMHNDVWNPQAPRCRKQLTDVTMTVAYDPVAYTSIIAMVNVVQGITVTFPDGSTLAFWGFLRIFEPTDHTEGEQPEAEMTITPAMYDPTFGNNFVEAGIALAPTPGT